MILWGELLHALTFHAQCWKMSKHTLKILRCSNRKIFKVCLIIFQRYAWKVNTEKWQKLISLTVVNAKESIFQNSVKCSINFSFSIYLKHFISSCLTDLHGWNTADGGAFRTLPGIYVGVFFCKNSEQFLPVNYLRSKSLSYRERQLEILHCQTGNH